jgi:hypothetical protein
MELKRKVKKTPIIFSTDMVLAILDKRKTKTRRVMNPQPPAGTTFLGHLMPADLWYPCNGDPKDVDAWSIIGDPIKCRYGWIGDRIWVKETWCNKPWGKSDLNPFYKASSLIQLPAGLKWQSPRFMPKCASRLDLPITDVGAEILEDITEEDAKQEGVLLTPCTHPDCIVERTAGGKTGRCASDSYRGAFAVEWNLINADRGYPWGLRTWVWTLSFSWEEPQ